MSSLPEIFKTQQSSYIKPSKQGGIYTLKFQENIQDYATIIQPQQFYSTKISKNESRAGTSHTIRSQKKVSFTDSRNVATSQSYRKTSSRNFYSRASSRQIRRDMFANYGNSRVTFMIGQTAPLNSQQAQSLIHKLNEGIQQMNKCEQILQQTKCTGFQIKQQFSRINHYISNEIKQIQTNSQRQIHKLRTMLSQLRRSSGMQIKVSKKELLSVEQNLQTISTILAEIDQSSAYFHQICIK